MASSHALSRGVVAGTSSLTTNGHPKKARRPEVRSALFVNLLTEDNLPYYFRDIERMFGADGPWGEWVRRWTAEEGRHATVIRDYLTVTRMIDPVALERGRMAR